MQNYLGTMLTVTDCNFNLMNMKMNELLLENTNIQETILHAKQGKRRIRKRQTKNQSSKLSQGPIIRFP